MDPVCLVSAGSGCAGSWEWAPREYSEGFRQRLASLFRYEKERRLSVTWEFKTTVSFGSDLMASFQVLES